VRFDFQTFLSLKLHEAVHSAGAGMWALAGVQALLYPPLHLAFRLDEVLHPEIRDVRIQRPLFILGCPRSGTTLLFHLLAAHPQVASHTLYEMIVPSVILRRLVPRRIEDRFVAWVESWFTELEPIHPFRLRQPEEDEILFFLVGKRAASTATCFRTTACLPRGA
jgi:hypothetical protein